MSYLHVGIPLNLTSVQHHITAFQSYLSQFTSLKTNHTNKILFARVISELSAFANTRLNEYQTKLKFLDHVLPADNSPPSRHKRFFDIVMWQLCTKRGHDTRVANQLCRDKLPNLDSQIKLCSSQLASTKARIIPATSYLYLPIPRQSKQFVYQNLQPCYDELAHEYALLGNCTEILLPQLKTTLDNCLTELALAHADVNYQPSPIPHKTPFSNFTTTTTTTEAPTTYHFYPFPPTRPPYHITSTPHIRHTRQILAAAALATGVLGTFLGLFNNNEISEIQTNLLNLSDQHNILTNIVQKHEREIGTLHDQLTHLTSIVEQLILYNPALVYAILDKTLHSIDDKITSLFDALQQLQHQRLAVTLLDEFQLKTVFDSAAATALARNIFMLPTRPQDLFQLDTSYIRSQDEVLMILHIPCVSTDSLLTLYEYIPFPYPLTQSVPNLSPPSSDNLHTLQDLVDANHLPSSSALFFKSDAPMIAIGSNKNLDYIPYRLVSQSDLSSCIQKNHIYLCEHHQTLRKDLPGSCLGALYVQHEEGVIQNCQIIRRPLQEKTFRLSPTKHIVFSPYPLTTQINCNNGSHFTQKLSGTTTITIPPLCSIQLVNHTITSDGNIRLAPDPLIFEWDFKPNLLPTNLLTTYSHLDTQLAQIHYNLTQFRTSPNDTISDQQFSDLIHNHITTFSNSSLVIWLSLSLTFLVGLITVILTCVICRRSRLRRLRRRRALLDPEASAPFTVMTTYGVAPSDEDEISYIARTGNTSGSSKHRRIIRS